jgi:hypothetical protein
MSAGDDSVWLIQVQWDELTGSQVGPDGLSDHQGFSVRSPKGWDATVDSTGVLWVVWADEGFNGTYVFARRRTEDGWGPRLQVSTGGGDTQPRVTSDEYGNVWIFWRRDTGGHSVWMCRMGPRSGQETFVVLAEIDGPFEVASRCGALYVWYHTLQPNAFRQSFLVSGTEHGGFGAPIPVG